MPSHHVNCIPQNTCLPDIEILTFRRFPFSSRRVGSVMSFQHAMCRYCCSLVYIHEWKKDIAVSWSRDQKWTLHTIRVKKFKIFLKTFMTHTVTLDRFHELAGLLVLLDSINKLPDSKFLNGQLFVTFFSRSSTITARRIKTTSILKKFKLVLKCSQTVACYYMPFCYNHMSACSNSTKHVCKSRDNFVECSKKLYKEFI